MSLSLWTSHISLLSVFSFLFFFFYRLMLGVDWGVFTLFFQHLHRSVLLRLKMASGSLPIKEPLWATVRSAAATPDTY